MALRETKMDGRVLRAVLACCATWFLVGSALAQWEAADPDPQLEAYTNFLGQGMSFVDFNHDGWDDLTLANASGALSFYAGGPDGLAAVDLGISAGTGRPISLMWLDIDNDGDRDFLHSAAMPYSLFSGAGLVSKSQVWINEDGVFVDRSSAWGFGVLENRSCTGMAFQDLDLDRDLDVMVAVYAMPCSEFWLTENVLLEHTGAAFSDVSAASGIADGLQSTFQGSWVHLNGDSLPDLFVINDAGVEVDCDVANAAYLNNGDGTFSEASLGLGLDVSMASMSITVGDPDGDGEEEVFVTNQEADELYGYSQVTGAYFDRNGAGVYAQQAAAVGLDIDRWSWGSMWVDFDADGWEDLMVPTCPIVVPGFSNGVTEYDNYLLRHPGAGIGAGAVFTDALGDWEGGDMPLYNLVRGDLNGDLRPDVVGLGLGQYAGIWMNASLTAQPSHHGLTVAVCGSFSNSEAIGTRLVLHAGGHAQQRTLRAGEDLYVQHSATQFFGLGTAEVADSLELFWPAGGRSVWYGLAADTAHHFVEGQEAINVAFGAQLPGDSVALVLTSPPHWTGLTVNGVALDSTEFVAAIGQPTEVVWTWMNGLFAVTRHVDWALLETSGAGCTMAVADNYDPEATQDDGSCTFNALCGAGTVWSPALQQCVIESAICAEDLNGNGLVDIEDMLMLLGVFGTPCTDP